ncbi:alpha/beta fold hydrolase [Natrarchaeobius oligotrophus]|uniref:Alpha/beta fold hydrolase n=1 Tax=Natrarchaeobius chitinivorans TaxID=1679083 RepID=A0A3N6MCI1_NATCH|nr:alpha/beta hydrolase [Natrarchaeobius chitinivorans]RQG98444.1 alpha/beta fold hydrolase [Natrarchaeobius chitinivorans]
MLTPIRSETGRLAGAYPYVRVGDGPKTLLVVPGIGDAMFDGEYGRIGALAARASFRRFLDEYTVWVVSRPRGLGDGRSVTSMARDYARVLEAHVGPAAVLGVSMGGLIGQELARLRPDLVERLVVAVSGCRLAAAARPTIRSLRTKAIEREWVEIRSQLLERMHTGTRRRLYPTLSRTVGRLRPPTPADPRDVVVSFDAVLEYDGTDGLDEIETRTLVVGGDDDPFFPESILRETHAGLPDAQLAMFRNARHGAYLERKEAFDNWVRRFLDGEAARVHESGARSDPF